jgi:hypothetical protein
MTGAYDVLARIRANRNLPQPAGERCEMCAEPIADEHQHVVNVEGRQLMCVCRGLPRLRARPAGMGSAADPGRPGVLLPQLHAGPHGRVLPGSGRRHRIRAGLGGVEQHSRRRSARRRARRRHRGADRPGARAGNSGPAVLSRPDRRLLRVRRPVAPAVAWVRRRPTGPRVHRRLLRAGRDAQSDGAAMTGKREAKADRA